METYKRVFVIVLDSLGIGAMPDSEKFGDRGVDTFGHILDKMGTLDIPNLQKLPELSLFPVKTLVLTKTMHCILSAMQTEVII